jgi:hypothetical protein
MYVLDVPESVAVWLRALGESLRGGFVTQAGSTKAIVSSG